jgi:ribonuclease G
MKKLLIDFSGETLRLAVLENGKLKDLIIENKNNKSVSGDIFLGVVKNVIPNQFAFVDIGAEKNAFLQLNDHKNIPLVENGILEGKEVLVQALKDPTGQKGACVTGELAFSGRFAALLTGGDKIGVSKKILDIEKRKHLKKIAAEILPPNFGVIMRTQSADATDEEIKSELSSLAQEAGLLIQKAKYAKGPAVLRRRAFFAEKAVKEIFRNDIDEIVLSDELEIENVKTATDAKKNNIRISIEETPFREIEREIKKLLSKKIWLKSGGFLIIEQTEACVVIDVNTGKQVKGGDPEAVFLRANLEACAEAANQIRLRNLSGMILIDFINMRSHESKQILIKSFTEELLKDRISTTIVGMTELGLMQVTRKKTREPLLAILKKKCEYCNGEGYILC